MSRGYTRRWRVLTRPNPAVATDWEIKAPGGAWLRIVSLVARLVSDANVANRGVVFQADDGERVWWMHPAASLVTANSTVDFVLNTGAAHTSIVQGVVLGPLPLAGLLLAPGHRLRPITGSIQAGDQWSRVAALVDEVPSDEPFIGDMSYVFPEDVRSQPNG